MGRYLDQEQSSNTSSNSREVTNSITGTFGEGNVRFITQNELFTIPASSIRVRLWGAGADSNGSGAGAGGGFSLKVINGLTIGNTVAATIGMNGNPGGTTSFGAHCSATGGTQSTTSSYGVAGTGIGGDINTSGGGTMLGNYYPGGGGCGTVFGNGSGTVGQSFQDHGFSGFNGSGAASTTSTDSQCGNGGNGLTSIGGRGAWSFSATAGRDGTAENAPSTHYTMSLDYIGTGGGGGGGGKGGHGWNGGGGGGGTGSKGGQGGYPGGGAGATTSGTSFGARGLIIVEW